MKYVFDCGCIVPGDKVVRNRRRQKTCPKHPKGRITHKVGVCLNAECKITFMYKKNGPDRDFCDDCNHIKYLASQSDMYKKKVDKFRGVPVTRYRHPCKRFYTLCGKFCVKPYFPCKMYKE